MKLSKLLVLLSCWVAAILVTACDVQPALVEQTVAFNSNMSGTYQALLAFTQSDYASMFDYYGNDPADEVAAMWAKDWKMRKYDYEHYTANGYHWIRIITNFADQTEYESFIEIIDINLPEQQYPGLYNNYESTLFSTLYFHEGTWLSGNYMDTPLEWSSVPWFYSARLPGEIVETNGEIQNDRQTVTWELSYYTHTPYRLITKIQRISKIKIQHQLEVDRNLSGSYSLTLGFLAQEYEKLATYYNTTKPEKAIAEELAKRFEWYVYKQQRKNKDGIVMVEIQVPFNNLAALQRIYQGMADDTDSSAKIEVKQVNNRYELNATPIHLCSKEFNDNPALVEHSMIMKLPGHIIKTNGESYARGSAIWNQNSPSISITTENTSNSFHFLLIAGAVIGLFGIVMIRRRRRSDFK